MNTYPKFNSGVQEMTIQDERPPIELAIRVKFIMRRKKTGTLSRGGIIDLTAIATKLVNAARNINEDYNYEELKEAAHMISALPQLRARVFTVRNALKYQIEDSESMFEKIELLRILADLLELIRVGQIAKK